MTTLGPRPRGLLGSSGRALRGSPRRQDADRLPPAPSVSSQRRGAGVCEGRAGKEKTQDRLSNWLAKKNKRNKEIKHRYLGSTTPPAPVFQTPAPRSRPGSAPSTTSHGLPPRVSADWPAGQPRRKRFEAALSLASGCGASVVLSVRRCRWERGGFCFRGLTEPQGPRAAAPPFVSGLGLEHPPPRPPAQSFLGARGCDGPWVSLRRRCCVGPRQG